MDIPQLHIDKYSGWRCRIINHATRAWARGVNAGLRGLICNHDLLSARFMNSQLFPTAYYCITPKVQSMHEVKCSIYNSSAVNNLIIQFSRRLCRLASVLHTILPVIASTFSPWIIWQLIIDRQLAACNLYARSLIYNMMKTGFSSERP
jgi:hypothetical protein